MLKKLQARIIYNDGLQRNSSPPPIGCQFIPYKASDTRQWFQDMYMYMFMRVGGVWHSIYNVSLTKKLAELL